ncbi:MAG: hypothetical protein AB7F08_13540 [Dongiaceae bacterium]
MNCRTLPIAFLTTLGLIATAGSVSADPAAVVAALKAAPATLFDLGLARLEAKLGADGAVEGYNAHGYYQDDMIGIYAYSYEIEPSEPNCKKIVDRIKRAGAVDPETGWPDDPASIYASLFSFPSIDEFAVDETYMETVDSMFHIMVVLGVTGDGKGMVCKSKLLSTDISYSWE